MRLVFGSSIRDKMKMCVHVKRSRVICFICTILVYLSGCAGVHESRGVKDRGYQWYAHSAEYEAMCYQSFNLAKMHLHDVRTSEVKYAVVIDLDETVLSNQAFMAHYVTHQGKHGFNWRKALKQWVHSQQNTLIPGARDFLMEADALGFTLFYVTNRQEDERSATLAQLQKLQLPQVMDTQLKTSTRKQRNKAPRIDAIRDSGYLIHLLIGDALFDVAPSVYGLSVQEQKRWVEQHQARLGTRAILLPNPVYGKWWFG